MHPTYGIHELDDLVKANCVIIDINSSRIYKVPGIVVDGLPCILLYLMLELPMEFYYSFTDKNPDIQNTKVTFSNWTPVSI